MEKSSLLSAARQIPESNSLLCVVRVRPMVSVRGKTPIPTIQWAYTRGNRQLELFKVEHVRPGNTILWMTRHDTGGNLSSLACHQLASLGNTVKFLICPSVVTCPLAGRRRYGNHPPDVYQEPFVLVGLVLVLGTATQTHCGNFS